MLVIGLGLEAQVLGLECQILGLVLKESLRTIFVSSALALNVKSLALALQQVLVIVLECSFIRR